MEQVIVEVEAKIKSDFRNQDLATKKDIKELELKIEQAKNQTIIWIFGMLIVFGGSILGVLAKGFHWF